MNLASQVIKRKDESFSAENSFSHPIGTLDLFSPHIPAPHLETFLTELNEHSPSLIESDFVAELYAVSTEDIEPSEEQIVYAKMCAFGFCANPALFEDAVRVTLNASGAVYLETTVRIASVIHKLDTASSLVVNIFGIDRIIAEEMTAQKITPSGVIVRLAQIGVVSIESLFRANALSRSFPDHHSALAYHGNLAMHDLTTELDVQLSGVSANVDTLTFLKLTSNTELAIEAVKADVDAREVIGSLRETAANADAALKSKINGMDNFLITSMYENA